MLKFFGFLLALLGAAMGWQHLRYARARRDVVQDRQAPWHSTARFHVVTFVECAHDDDLRASVAGLRDSIEAAGSAQVIYAGQAAFTMESSQIGPADWDAVVLAQYDSRGAYDVMAESAAYREALDVFVRHYSHGMQRNWLLNLLIPQGLLALRLFDLVRGQGNSADFEPAAADEKSTRLATLTERAADLRALTEVNRDAMVVFNLIKSGDAEQEAANRAYGRRMMGRFAALGHGPVHIGRAVTLEGDAEFNQVVAVYYPGPEYFASMLESRFFNAIIDGKQLSDTQVVPTVPILPLLDS